MARPKGSKNKIKTNEKLDWEQIEKLYGMHCTDIEVADFLSINRDTLRACENFKEVKDRGLSKGKASLRKAMFQKALGGNVTAQIWLSKQHLGMCDKTEEDEQLVKEKVREIKLRNQIAEKIVDSSDDLDDQFKLYSKLVGQNDN